MRSQFQSGTHTLAVALFGLLRAGDTLLAATGRPYDTLVSVRSGARQSMPGMMDTILNLGLNDEAVEGQVNVVLDALGFLHLVDLDLQNDFIKISNPFEGWIRPTATYFNSSKKV